jgi:MraZ protein
MFRGSYQARIDEKGRLKVPSGFRALIEESFGRQLFVTSLKGDHVWLYPMPTWDELERKLGAIGVLRDPMAQRFLRLTNHYGQAAEMDNQGRILIHPRLRKAADTNGEVEVVGNVDHIQIWNSERMAAKVEEDKAEQDKLTDADWRAFLQSLR